jgi:hypothetical protein
MMIGNMQIGDITRDWKNVDWYAAQSRFDHRITVSATVNGAQVRAYDFSTDGMPLEAIRLMNDMMAALKQHRGQG